MSALENIIRVMPRWKSKFSISLVLEGSNWD